MSVDSEKEAKEALRATLRVQRELGMKGDINDNKAIARNVLHEELGYYGERKPQYDLEEGIRDTLIAHGRQDAAGALLNTISLLNEIKRLKRLCWLIIFLLIVIMMKIFS